MVAITTEVLVLGVINLLAFPILAFFIKRGIGRKLDEMDEKRESARRQRESEVKDSRMWQQSMERGMKSLLRAELLHEHNKWVRKGYCPFSSKKYLESLHDAYKGVGGNSIGDKLYEETISLPTQKEDAE